MAEQETLSIVQQFFDTWNAHDPGGLDRVLASEFVSESDTLPQTIRGLAAEQQVMRMYLSAFPDLRFTIENASVSSTGDLATVRWQATGTHKGDLMGLAPTQRQGESRGCSIFEVRDGRIMHEWLYWDTGHLLRQLGALPERTMSAGR